jgi:class 3 adenylate cyclase/predicted negative regulator of RcsB-dependent stress response
LIGRLGEAHVLAGEMEEAREIRDAGTDDLYLAIRLQIASGDWEAAEQRLVADMEESGRVGDMARLSIACVALGDLCTVRGEYAAAERYLRTGLDRLENEGSIYGVMMRTTRLVPVLVRSGHLDQAQLLLDRCLDVLAQGEDWGGMVGRVAFARGQVLSAQGTWSDAAAAFDEALAVARRYGLPWDEAEVLHERARLHLARGEGGDRRQALRLLDDTIAIYQRLGAKKHIEFVVADKIHAQGIESVDFQTSIDAVAAGVQREHTDLRQHAAPDGTVTILFSDIEGSTQMTERLGDQRWLQVLREHNRIVREQLAAHGGYEVKSQGDGFMLAFQSARRALHCAIAIQRAFAVRNQQHAEESLRVRIGLHAGEVIKEADDFFGKNVILAARIAAQASGGEILVSALVQALTHSAGDITFDAERDVALKGLSGTHRLVRVAWQ